MHIHHCILYIYIHTHKILDLVFISEKNNSPSPYGFWITFRTVSFLAPKLLLKYSKEGKWFTASTSSTPLSEALEPTYGKVGAIKN